MMTRRIITIVLTLVIGFGAGFWYRGCQFRQGWGSPWRNPEGISVFLKDKLDLTEDQSTKVRTIVEEARTKMDALRQKVRPEFKALHDATHEEISTLLNDEQKKTFDELRKEFEARRQERMKDRGDRFDN